MNKNIFLLMFAAVVMVLGCNKKNDNPPNTAEVAFVNGCAGTTGLDAKVNNIVVPGATNISFMGNTGYKPVTAGSSINIAYYLTNLGTPATSQTTTLTVGTSYTAFAGGLITSPSFLLTTDNLAAPSSGNAKVRFVNLSPDSAGITANVQATEIATGILSMHASDFTQVPAGSWEIKAGQPSSIASVISGGIQSFGAGKIYTIIMTGTQSGTGQSALKLTLLHNN
jgi:hypothetical protein